LLDYFEDDSDAHFTRDMKRSVESEFIPAPLFFLDVRIVCQMSSDREYCWCGEDEFELRWTLSGTGVV
jgi:hypothetical protein